MVERAMNTGRFEDNLEPRTCMKLHFLTTCCQIKPDKDLNRDIAEITNHKLQTNHNDRNSKYQTVGVDII